MPKGQGKATVKDVMHKFKQGTLHSGPDRYGHIVPADRVDQAIAIALSEAGLSDRSKQRGNRPRQKR
jgi:Family of unknown function (DUF6496)